MLNLGTHMRSDKSPGLARGAVIVASRAPAVAAAAATLFFLLAGCGNASSTPASSTDYLTEETPPCIPAQGSSVDPCGPRPATMLVPKLWLHVMGVRIAFDVDLSSGIGENFYEKQGTPPGVEEQLGTFSLDNLHWENFVTHVVARATFLPGTERCTSGAEFRPASYDESLAFLMPVLSTVQCFADVRVNSYILGTGSPKLTVQTGLYLYSQFVSEVLKEAAEDITLEEAAERLRASWERITVNGEQQFHYEAGGGRPTSVTYTGGIRGKEAVLFLGPSINHATEAWQVFETWNVERKDDGTVVAVHPRRAAWEISRYYSRETHGPLLEIELPRFRQKVAMAAQARREAFGGRVGADETLPMLALDTHDLREFLTAAGAYDYPGSPPLPPPPVPGPGQAVPDIGEGPFPLEYQDS